MALLLRDLLADDGLAPRPEDHRQQGHAALRGDRRDHGRRRTSAYAHELAEQLEAAHPELVVSRMTKKLRPGKVFIDWSQNNAAKTTVAPYSLRARPTATVSTPLTWDEVAATAGRGAAAFTPAEVLARVDDGDLFAPLLAGGKRPRLPA